MRDLDLDSLHVYGLHFGAQAIIFHFFNFVANGLCLRHFTLMSYYNSD